jgi:sodium pump decarboxylase gamma subunit
MGSEVTMSEALIVTFVSMLVVFLVLILISYIIGLLKKFGAEKPQLIEKKDMPSNIKEELVPVTKSEIDQEELVAVISAAVAASMGLNIPDIRISSISRVPQQTTAWREIGKQEQLFGKL